MTKEQWMLYFYGIYPEGGTFFVLTILFLLFLFVNWVYIVPYRDIEGLKYKDLNYRPLIMVSIIYSFMFFIHLLVPPKNIAVAIIAAPYGVSMLENNASKINKLDEILDLSLDKVIMKLKDK